MAKIQNISAKQKGNSAEETVARRFTKWTGIAYKRRTGSGASDNHDHRLRGDVAPLFPSANTIFSIECKNRTTKGINDINFSDLQDGYKQSCGDAMTYRIPIVLVMDKHKNLFMLIHDIWLLRIIQLTGNTSLLNIRLAYSKLYKQSLLPFEKFTEKVNYFELQSKRNELKLEKIDTLETALQFAINIKEQYHYDLMTVPEFVHYYNTAFKRKKITRSHVFHALQTALIHGLILRKDGKERKLVALTERTVRHIFRYKSPKTK